MPHGKICYLEIPANRAEDSARFYADIFGWKARERGDGNLAFGPLLMQTRPPLALALMQIESYRIHGGWPPEWASFQDDAHVPTNSERTWETSLPQ
jgi:hypothetical protein